MSREPLKSTSTVVITKERLDQQGGLEKYARRLITAFTERGCNVTVLTTSPSQTLEKAEVVTLGSRSPSSLVNLWQFNRRCRQWLKDNPRDIVFGMDRTTEQTHYRAGNGVHAAFLQRRSREESILRNLSFTINPRHRLILTYERQAFHNPHLRQLFVNSDMVRQEVRHHYSIDPAKVSVVHNGVEWHEWQQHFDQWPSNRLHIQQTLGLDPNAFQLLFIGHGFRRKGLHHLLQGLAALRNRDVQLSVVGKDKENAWFQQLAHRLGIASQVKFFGARSDIVFFYQAADALVIPSTYDPFANVTVEALAMGLFVASSTHNGGSEILTPTTGCLIEAVEDPDAVTAALTIALQHPKTTASSQAIRTATLPYDFSNQLNTIVDKTLETTHAS